MKPAFHVVVEHFEVLKEIAGVWGGDDFRALLDAVDFGDTAGLSDAELREMCLLALQELEPADAAVLVLTRHLGGRLTRGQIQHLSTQMEDEKLWEEGGDMSLHEGLFHVGSLLYAAQPGRFPEPDAVRAVVQVSGLNAAAQALLAKPLHESLVVRLLADGMDERAALHRLFDAELTGKPFADAVHIAWTVRTDKLGDALRLEVVGSGYWLDALRSTRSFESTAKPDT